MEPGTVYSFPLENGLLGACRVIRKPANADEKKRFKGCVLAHATKWVGKHPIDLKHADLRKVVRGRMGPMLMWIKGRLPKTFEEAGIVPVRKPEAAKTSNGISEWESFPYAIFTQWRKENEPDAQEKRTRENKKKAEQAVKESLARVRKNESIDLSRFVPLKKTKKNALPMRSFVDSSPRCKNGKKKVPASRRSIRTLRSHNSTARPCRRFSMNSAQQKKRTYGRLGSYSIPPEYNPRKEKTIEVRQCTRTRIEVDTQEQSGFERKNTYVLLRKKGCWLIDSKKSNGQNSIL